MGLFWFLLCCLLYHSKQCNRESCPIPPDMEVYGCCTSRVKSTYSCTVGRFSTVHLLRVRVLTKFWETYEYVSIVSTRNIAFGSLLLFVFPTYLHINHWTISLFLSALILYSCARPSVFEVKPIAQRICEI